METAASPQIFTVSGLNYKIKHELRALFPCIQVKGEVSNLKKQASGHIYFTLKDAGAQISCAWFRGQAMGQVPPKEGDEIVASGQVDVYAPRGQYQLIVTSIKRSGLGDLLVQLEALKQKLLEKGLFANNRPLPPFPKRIGVISSPTGAVIRDICHVLKRRSRQFHLILNPVAVQGTSCPDEVASAIECFNAFKNVDVIIVARGGGSIEDLWGFNSEKVVAAIFNSEIPIISAVGHETDTTLSDLAADVRAPTPSAAAEIVMSETSALMEKLGTYQSGIVRAIRVQIERRRIAASHLFKHPVLTKPDSWLADFYQKMDLKQEQLTQSWSNLIEKRKNQINEQKRHLGALKPSSQVIFIRQKLGRAALAIKTRAPQMVSERLQKLLSTHRRLLSALHSERTEIHLEKKRLNTLKDQLVTTAQTLIEKKRALLSSHKSLIIERDPRAILKKGYAIVFSQNKESIILSSKELKTQKHAWIRHSDGETEVEIT